MGADPTQEVPLMSLGCQSAATGCAPGAQGLLYAKLTLSEQQESPGTAEPRVFGLPLAPASGA